MAWLTLGTIAIFSVIILTTIGLRWLLKWYDKIKNEIKKKLIIAAVLLTIIIMSYPLSMGAVYNLVAKDARFMSIIDGIKPIIDFLYSIALILGCFVLCLILYLSYLEHKKSIILDGEK